LISSGLFGESAPLLVPVTNLPQGEALSVFLNLPDAGIPESPLDRGENQDARSMTLHVQKLELTTTNVQSNLVKTDIVEEPEISTTKSVAYIPENMSLDYSTDSFFDTSLNCLPVDVSTPPILPKVSFSKGWWAQEAFGRWMKDQQAIFEMSIPDNRDGKSTGRYVLRLEGDFFMNRIQTVSAIIDGKESGPFTLAEDGALIATFENAAIGDSVNVVLKLSGKTTQSPKTLGVSQDDRTLTYFLKSAQLIPA